VRHLTEKQLDELEKKENKNGAALAMEMCDIDGLHRQTFGSVTYRVQKELKQGRLGTDRKTSPAKELQSSVYRARPWTPEEDGILLELTKRQRTTLLSYKVIARNEDQDSLALNAEQGEPSKPGSEPSKRQLAYGEIPSIRYKLAIGVTNIHGPSPNYPILPHYRRNKRPEYVRLIKVYRVYSRQCRVFSIFRSI